MLGHTGLQAQDITNLLALRSQVRLDCRAAKLSQSVLLADNAPQDIVVARGSPTYSEDMNETQVVGLILACSWVKWMWRT